MKTYLLSRHRNAPKELALGGCITEIMFQHIEDKPDYMVVKYFTAYGVCSAEGTRHIDNCRRTWKKYVNLGFTPDTAADDTTNPTQPPA